MRYVLLIFLANFMGCAEQQYHRVSPEKYYPPLLGYVDQEPLPEPEKVYREPVNIKGVNDNRGNLIGTMIDVNDDLKIIHDTSGNILGTAIDVGGILIINDNEGNPKTWTTYDVDY